MDVFISVLVVAASLLMIFVVLIQNPKGGGISSAFGSATQFGSVRKTTDLLEKSTWGLVIAILVLSILSAPFNTTTTVVKEDDTKVYMDGTGGLDNSQNLPQ
jgi:preprotein translocase subunit SecG